MIVFVSLRSNGRNGPLKVKTCVSTQLLSPPFLSLTSSTSSSSSQSSRASFSSRDRLLHAAPPLSAHPAIPERRGLQVFLVDEKERKIDRNKERQTNRQRKTHREGETERKRMREISSRRIPYSARQRTICPANN